MAKIDKLCINCFYGNNYSSENKTDIIAESYIPAGVDF
jgi:hypothetical protein